MTNKQAIDFIQRAQRILRVQDWKIEFMPVQAKVTNNDYRTALLSSRPFMMDGTITIAMMREDDEIKVSVWHEVVHLLLEPLRDIADDVAGQLGPGGKQLAKDRLDIAEERIVERLAKALVELDSTSPP